MEIKCLRNASKNCWNRLIDINYMEIQACLGQIECPEQKIMVPTI